MLHPAHDGYGRRRCLGEAQLLGLDGKRRMEGGMLVTRFHSIWMSFPRAV